MLVTSLPSLLFPGTKESELHERGREEWVEHNISKSYIKNSTFSFNMSFGGVSIDILTPTIPASSIRSTLSLSLSFVSFNKLFHTTLLGAEVDRFVL